MGAASERGGRVLEKDYQRTIVRALGVLGWSSWHTRPAMNINGRWTTPTTAEGIPDLIALRGPALLAIEVKGERTMVRAEQIEWLQRFALVPCARAWILRPQDDWDTIVEWMRFPNRAPRTFGWTPR